MPAAERDLVMTALVAARAELLVRIAALDREFDQLVAAADLEPPDDEHDPDGTTAYERAQVTSMALECRARLDAVDRAIAAADRPGFGSCELCGEAIGSPRMLAIPETRRCIRCATR